MLLFFSLCQWLQLLQPAQGTYGFIKKRTVIQRDNQQEHILLFFDFQDIYHDNVAEREQNSKRKNSTNIRPAKRGMEKEFEKKTTSEKQDKQPEKSQLRQKKFLQFRFAVFIHIFSSSKEMTYLLHDLRYILSYLWYLFVISVYHIFSSFQTGWKKLRKKL